MDIYNDHPARSPSPFYLPGMYHSIVRYCLMVGQMEDERRLLFYPPFAYTTIDTGLTTYIPVPSVHDFACRTTHFGVNTIPSYSLLLMISSVW